MKSSLGCRLLLWTMPVTLAACHTDTKSTSATTSPPLATISLHAAPAATPLTTYRGALPGQADSITLYLLAGRGLDRGEPLGTDTLSYSGTYYGADGIPQFVAGQPLRSAPDSVLLEESAQNMTLADEDEMPETDTWRLRRLPTGELTGTRAGAPIRLRPVRLPGGVAFTQHAFTDSVAALPKEAHTPYGRVSLRALLPVANDAAVQRTLTQSILRSLFSDYLDKGPAPASLKALWQQRRTAFSKFYREDAQAMVANQPLDSVPDYTLRYIRAQAMDVYCNESDLLSVGFTRYSYSGGAHGGYGTAAASYDLRSGRALQFADIFLPAAHTRLVPVLNRAVRRTMGLEQDEPLDEMLFVKQMPVTHNVYLTPDGVIFIYLPYEIASYAQGEIRVFVPYAEVRGLLRPGLPVADNRPGAV